MIGVSALCLRLALCPFTDLGTEELIVQMYTISKCQLIPSDSIRHPIFLQGIHLENDKAMLSKL